MKSMNKRIYGVCLICFMLLVGVPGRMYGNVIKVDKGELSPNTFGSIGWTVPASPADNVLECYFTTIMNHAAQFIFNTYAYGEHEQNPNRLAYTYSLYEADGDEREYALPIRLLSPNTDYLDPTAYLPTGKYKLVIKLNNKGSKIGQFSYYIGYKTTPLRPTQTVDKPIPLYIKDQEPYYGNAPVAGITSSRSYLLEKTMLSATGTSSLDKISYVDGIGRPVQTVHRGITPLKSDLVDFTDYDSRSYVWRQWLPTPVKGMQGAFINNLPMQAPTLNSDARPYTETVREASRVDRPYYTYDSGEAWKDHPTGFRYYSNTLTGLYACNKYFVSSTGLAVKNGIWPVGQISVAQTKDQDGNITCIFTDKMDRTLLERRMCDSIPSDTYYVYDALGNLSCVLPPAIADIDNLTESLMDQYAYRYKYDTMHRCISRKYPGCAAISYVYDIADRIIFTQDGNQKAHNEWTGSIADYYGREVLSFLYTSATVPSVTSVVKATYGSGTALSGTGYSLSGLSITPSSLLTVSYYDTYDFLNLTGLSTVKTELTYTDKTGYDKRYIYALTPALSAKGRLTGKRVFIPALNKEIVTAYYYDDKGRIVQQLESNHMGGFEKHYYAYTFTGKVLKHLHIHNVQRGVSRQEIYTYNYDHAERLTKVIHNQDSNPAVVLTENTYDEYCRLSQKKLHGGIDNLTYAYNTCGWVTGITSQKFNQKLYFTDGKGTPCYNGNISSMTWKTTNETTERGYKFTYDGLSRLKDAVYGEGTTLGNNPNSFNEQVTGYDKQGNILGLKRYGQTSATVCGLIDNLTMTYNGNQLKKVTDSAISPVYGSGFEFKEGTNQVTEYTYDANGNLTKDLNKKIAGIQYNCLNLPSRIAFEDGSTISYTYAMNGVKLRTVHVIAGVTTTTDYCGNVIYENGSAKTLLTEAGYISLNDNKYHYYIQDHQGNNRLVLNQNGTVEEVNHYYPFGGLFSNTTTVQPYKYNGKELDRKKGLDWYDYGARHYDAAIGRFSTVDPMTEKYYNANLYGYCANNPIKFIDPTGMVYRGYTVDEKGFIIPINEEGGDEYDVLYNLKKYSLKTSKNYDKSGKKAGIRISKGILSGTKERNMSSKQVKGAGVTLDGHSTGKVVLNHAYEVQSDEESLSIMDFLDRNTDVEWSNTLMENGQDRRVNLLDTSHEEGTVRLETHQLGKYTRVGFKVIRADHIHPKPGDTTPSGEHGDLGNARAIRQKYSEATFRILNNGKYYDYTKSVDK